MNKFALLISALFVGAIAQATEIRMEKLPDDVVGIVSKTVKLNTVLNIRPGEFGEGSPARTQGVTEVELNFFKLKDGSLKLDRGFARLPKDTKGVVYSLPLNSFDSESYMKIIKAYELQTKTKFETYDAYMRDRLFRALQEMKVAPAAAAK